MEGNRPLDPMSVTPALQTVNAGGRKSLNQLSACNFRRSSSGLWSRPTEHYKLIDLGRAAVALGGDCHVPQRRRLVWRHWRQVLRLTGCQSRSGASAICTNCWLDSRFLHSNAHCASRGQAVADECHAQQQSRPLQIQSVSPMLAENGLSVLVGERRRKEIGMLWALAVILIVCGWRGFSSSTWVER